MNLPPNSDRGRTSCRSCGGHRLYKFVDLGVSPLCEAFLSAEEAEAGEKFYPLDVRVCDACWLAQLGEYVVPEDIFKEYAYFSSFSQAWLAHAQHYAGMAINRFHLGADSFVVEVASNDGYLLKNFVTRQIPCLGIEPAANVARAAEAAGVPTLVHFLTEALGKQVAAEGCAADLLIGNNVLAQVPDLNDFVAALRVLLKKEGVLTLEFPHLLRLFEQNQFDTIYHEHFSYYSLLAAERILSAHGLRVFDVEELWTHGGSLRLYVCHTKATPKERDSVLLIRAAERAAKLDMFATYDAFGERVIETKWRLLDLLISLKRQRARIVGYGAPGKGNTLLNYCGIRTDFLDFTVDRNPYKHGKLLPGSRIPVRKPEEIVAARPDYVLILPWNLKREIMQQLAYIRDWGGRFVIPIPEPEVIG